MGVRSWTPKQRRQQAEAIKKWRPWEQSTGPTSIEGKVKTSRNAYKGGEWLKLRNMIKTINAAVREHKDFLQE